MQAPQSDERKKKWESARCTIIDHSSTKNQVKNLYSESRNSGETPRKTPVNFSYVESAYWGFSRLWNRFETMWTDLIFWTKSTRINITAHCTAVLYEPYVYQSFDYVPDSGPIDKVVTLLCSNWPLLLRGNVAMGYGTWSQVAVELSNRFTKSRGYYVLLYLLQASLTYSN